jgi:hypothetical protein
VVASRLSASRRSVQWPLSALQDTWRAGGWRHAARHVTVTHTHTCCARQQQSGVSAQTHAPCQARIVRLAPHHQRREVGRELPQLRAAAAEPPQLQHAQRRQLRAQLPKGAAAASATGHKAASRCTSSSNAAASVVLRSRRRRRRHQQPQACVQVSGRHLYAVCLQQLQPRAHCASEQREPRLCEGEAALEV